MKVLKKERRKKKKHEEPNGQRTYIAFYLKTTEDTMAPMHCTMLLVISVSTFSSKCLFGSCVYFKSMMKITSFIIILLLKRSSRI